MTNCHGFNHSHCQHIRADLVSKQADVPVEALCQQTAWGTSLAHWLKALFGYPAQSYLSSAALAPNCACLIYPQMVGIPFQKIVAISLAFQVDLSSELFDRPSPLENSWKAEQRCSEQREAAELVLDLTSQPHIVCKPESAACASS